MKLTRLVSFLLMLLAVFTVSFTPVAGAMPAVVAPDGPCTLDFNPCGNGSICMCPDGYEYDASVGLCLIDNIFEATERGLDAVTVDSSCSIQAQPLFPCTRDINPLGYPSACACPTGTEYNELFAQCVIPLGY